MSEFDDVETRLEQWGSATQPDVDGAFANRLDAELRVLGRPDANERRPLWQPVLVMGTACVLLILGAVALLGNRSADDSLIMVAASDTRVALPSGEIVAGRNGLELPDGTLISVGPDGSAVIDDVVLEGGAEALINQGELEILAGRDETASPSTTDTQTSSSSTTDQAPDSTTSLGDGATSTPSTTASPTTATPTTATPTTAAPTTAPPTTAAPTTTPTDRTTPTSPARTEVRLDWLDRAGRIELRWTYTGPETLAGWEVTARRGDRSRTLAVLRDPEARSLTVERAPDVAVTYQVIARDADGRVIAESNPITVS